jgi:hypothetical protein
MQTVIMVRINGLISKIDKESYRQQLIKEMQEGLFIVDDSIKEVVVSNINNLGLEFNIEEEEENEKKII